VQSGAELGIGHGAELKLVAAARSATSHTLSTAAAGAVTASVAAAAAAAVVGLAGAAAVAGQAAVAGAAVVTADGQGGSKNSAVHSKANFQRGLLVASQARCRSIKEAV
jgi:hypothetical protein